MKSSETVFPEQIDNRLFWSDVNILQKEVYDNYQIKLSQNEYDEAREIIENSDVFYYGAWLINLFRNRLVAIEDYLPYVILSIANIYSPVEPTDPVDTIYREDEHGELVNTVIWIEGSNIRPKPVDMRAYVAYYMMVKIEDDTIDDLFEEN